MLKKLMVGLLSLLVIGLIWAAFFSTKSQLAQAATADPGFTDSLLVNVSSPTGLAFLTDGRMLITTQSGRLYVYRNNQLQTPAALDLTLENKVCYNSERGLLSVAVDPAFVNNRYIYTFYTYNQANYSPANNCPVNNNTGRPYNRVSRWVLGDDNKVVTTTETVIVDRLESFCGNHNGGDLKFGQDGLLYVSVGDSGCQIVPPYNGQDGNDNARRLDIPLGKILRVNPDGTVPTSNPFYNASGARRCTAPGGPDAGTGPCQETFVWGLRNPFRIAFKPNSNEFHINDVGGGVWEEINYARAGNDYGWNVREGYCNRGSSTTNCFNTPEATVSNGTGFYRGPLYAYQHGSCNSITGGVFVPPGVWPATYDNNYLFSDYTCNSTFRLNYITNTNTYSRTDFLTGLNGGPVHMEFGSYTVNNQATKALFYTILSPGQIRVVYYTGSNNRSPSVQGITATPTGGSVPLNVNFAAVNASDPDVGQTLTYLWNFGDGSPQVQTATPTVSYTYALSGTFFATLQVRDNLGGLSDVVNVKVTPGNAPPQPFVTWPTTDYRFTVGETITLTGGAVDPQGSPVTLTWQVDLVHDGPDTVPHIHPLLSASNGSNVPFTAPAPEGFTAATASYLIVRLTASDAGGASATITQALLPRRVNLTFSSTPNGASFLVNGLPLTAGTPAAQVVSWVGYNFSVNMTQTTQTLSGTSAVFQGWSDGGANAHTIVTPDSDAAYNANFTVNGCNALNVTTTADNVASPACGSLRYAINLAGDGAKITFSGAAGNGITLTDNLTITKAIILQGTSDCSSGTRLTLNATSPKVINLRGGATLVGLNLRGVRLNANGSGNALLCSKITTP